MCFKDKRQTLHLGELHACACMHAAAPGRQLAHSRGGQMLRLAKHAAAIFVLALLKAPWHVASEEDLKIRCAEAVLFASGGNIIPRGPLGLLYCNVCFVSMSCICLVSCIVASVPLPPG